MNKTMKEVIQGAIERRSSISDFTTVLKLMWIEIEEMQIDDVQRVSSDCLKVLLATC